MTSDIVVCVGCAARVIARGDGSCPACGAADVNRRPTESSDPYRAALVVPPLVLAGDDDELVARLNRRRQGRAFARWWTLVAVLVVIVDHAQILPIHLGWVPLIAVIAGVTGWVVDGGAVRQLTAELARRRAT